MYCTACGEKGQDGDRFCVACGRSVSGGEASGEVRPVQAGGAVDSVGESVSKSGDPGSERPRAPLPVPGWVWVTLRRGWWEATVAAGVVAVLVFALGLAAAVVVRVAAGDDWMLVGRELPVWQLGGLLGLGFARVGLRFEGLWDLVGVVQGTAQVTVSVLGAFGLIALGVAWAGRYAVRAAGVTRQGAAVLQGAKLGVPLAVAALVGALAFGVSTPRMSLGVSPAGSFGWGLLLGGLLGAAGGLWETSRAGPTGQAGHQSRGGSAGWRSWGWATAAAGRALAVGLLVAVAVAVVGVVLAGLETGAIGVVTDADGGVTTASVVGLLLVLPNLAVWLLAAAHGGTLQADLGPLEFAGESSLSVNFLSVPGVDGFTVAPWWVWLLLAIPAISVLLAGWWAADRAAAARPAEATAIGLKVGPPYAVAVWLAAVLATSGFDGRLVVGGEPVAGELAVGVSALGALFLPLVWATAGGLLGARLYAAGSAPAPQAGAAGQPPATVQPRASPVTLDANPTASSDAAEDPSAPVCTGCGSPLRPEQRFCTGCGTPHEPTPPAPADPGEPTLADEPNETGTTDKAEAESVLSEVCASCGVELRADQRFCTGCGTPHEPTPPAPADPCEPTRGDEPNETGTTDKADEAEAVSSEVCASCGVELRAEHRFCTACGASR